MTCINFHNDDKECKLPQNVYRFGKYSNRPANFRAEFMNEVNFIIKNEFKSREDL